MNLNLEGNKERFVGFSDLYDAARPTPPTALIDMVKQIGQVSSGIRVVDLGCGTGLSTFVWAKDAEEVIGIEPSEDMLTVAKSKTASYPNIHFIQAFSHNLPLEDQSVDIVCCSQSMHWMEPNSTLAEVNRILKKGGQFIVYDCLWPPTVHWEVELAWKQFFLQIREMEKALGAFKKVHYWPKHQHLERIKKSNYFRYVKEVAFSKQEKGNAERFIQLAMSQGQVQTILKMGCSEEEAGINLFKKQVKKKLGDTMTPWWFSYKVITALK